MSFLDLCAKNIEKYDLKVFQKKAGTFTAGFSFWKNNLFERAMRLFVYSNTDPVPPHEILLRLYLTGTCGISLYEDDKGIKELTAFFGSYTGVSKYFDRPPLYQMSSPVWSGIGVVDEDVAVIELNSLKNPIMPMIERYAMLLAHCDTTIIGILVSARDSGGVPVASSDAQKQSITDYQRKIYNGENGVVTDLAGLGVEYAGTNRNTSQDLTDVMDVRQKLLKNFYADLGIRASFEKKSNAVTDEVTSDTQMLLLNDSDMINSQKEGCDRVNNLFGTNWSVDLNPDIKREGVNDGLSLDS